jgi:hypothetical protein
MSVDPASIDALYEATLRPRLEALEGLRLDLKRQIRMAYLLVGVPFALFLGNGLLGALLGERIGSLIGFLSVPLIFVAMVGVALRYAIPGFAAYLNYQQRFKHEVVAEIFRLVSPGAVYDPNQGVTREVFDAAGLFNTRGNFQSDDRVRGTIGVTPFEAAEVRRRYSSGGKNSTTYVVFSGLFFHIDFNKTLRGTTLVQPRTARSHSIGDRTGLTEVTLEDPAFTTAFTVWASDQVEARYVLTPMMMEQLVTLQGQVDLPVFAAFRGSRVYLGVDYGRELFEPGIRATTSRDAIRNMAREFALAEAVVHELDLNTRIWTKGVDDSLLTGPDAVSADPLDAVVDLARQGTLTPERLWDTAVAATSEPVDDTPVLPPPAATTGIELRPRSTLVTYGRLPRFLISIALWLASVLLALAAMRAVLSDAAASAEFAVMASWLSAAPALSPFDAWVARLPVAWLAGACLVGSVTAFDWMLRVRSVEIEPARIRIRRGLRPWPRTYERPPYNRVTVINAAVYLKADGFSLYTPTASPILDAAEARWVAYEMQRALRR